MILLVKIVELKDVKPESIGRAGESELYRLMNEKLGSEKLGAALINAPPNAEFGGIHYHRQREMIFFVVEGAVTLELNGKEHTLHANTLVLISPGELHGIVRAGKEGFKILEVYTPQGPDRVSV